MKVALVALALICAGCGHKPPPPLKIDWSTVKMVPNDPKSINFAIYGPNMELLVNVDGEGNVLLKGDPNSPQFWAKVFAAVDQTAHQAEEANCDFHRSVGFRKL